MRQIWKKGPVLAVVVGLAVSMGNPDHSGEIRTFLESIGAADAVYVQQVPGASLPDGTPRDKRYDLYHSDVTGYDYYFHRNSGLLWEVDDPDGKKKEVEAVSDQVWKQRVLESVSMYLGENQIGQLEFESAHVNGSWCTSNVVEKYQGMETGTSVFVQCLRDGTTLTCLLRYGSIFPEALDDRNLLGEEKACAKAVKAMEKHMGGMTVQRTTCELKAVEDYRYYRVTLTVQTEPYIIEFYAHLDPHTGMLLEWYRTM